MERTDIDALAVKLLAQNSEPESIEFKAAQALLLIFNSANAVIESTQNYQDWFLSAPNRNVDFLLSFVDPRNVVSDE